MKTKHLMGNDVFALIERDHRELERGLIEIARATPEHARDILDGLRFGLAAHAGAEADLLDSLLGEPGRAERLQFFAAQVMAAHRAQERELEVLARMTPGSIAWHERVSALLEMVRQHDSHEQTSLVPALQACLSADAYGQLAPQFATGRLCVLTMAPPPRRHRSSRRL